VQTESFSGAAKAKEDFSVRLREFGSELKLLGFEQVSSACEELSEVVESWGDGWRTGTRGMKLGAWINRLANVAADCSVMGPASSPLEELRALSREWRDEQRPSGYSKRPTQPTALQVPKTRVLVCDDSPVIRALLLSELETRGLDVAQADGPTELCQRLIDFVPEIIFLDINMPEMQGDEACRMLRAHAQTEFSPIIFLSSLPEEELAKLAREAGASGYLSKKVGIKAIGDYLDDILEQVVL
jgi:CheY-like chemotaxis protein